MKRFVISGLSLLVLTATIAPAAQAKETEAISMIQQLRLEALDARTKSDNSLLGTSLQARRIQELNQRTKSDDSLLGTSLQARRIEELNQRTKIRVK